MPDRLTVEMTTRPPHGGNLPLSGVTVLVVDDSRLAGDGLHLMYRAGWARGCGGPNRCTRRRCTCGFIGPM